MEINCLTTFLDGRDRFENGERRIVQPTETETAEQRALRFIAAGWAEDVSGAVATGAPATGAVDLEIQDVIHTQSTPVGG